MRYLDNKILNLPLVSIIIPTYNRAHLIGETLDSVLEQTYQNWECIVVVDGFTDYTMELLEFYIEKDLRIKFHQRPNNRKEGANACRNYGFELSKGEYIQWLDSDDILTKDKIKDQLRFLNLLNKFSIATCEFGYFTSLSSNFVTRKNLSTYINFDSGVKLLWKLGRAREYFPLHVYLTPRILIECVGGWNENLSINQDGEFYTRILLITEKVVFVDTQVFYRASTSGNISVLNSREKAEGLINSWKLIEKHIYSKIGNSKHPYVLNGKLTVYNRIEMRYPGLISEYYKYFKSVIPFLKRFKYKTF